MSVADPSSESASQASANNWTELRTSALSSIRKQEIPSDIEVPALPQAVAEFVDQSSNPDFEFSELGRIIEKDPGLTCELLRYVNSGVLGPNEAIGSVTHALTHLGIKGARTYLMAAGVKAITSEHQSRLLNARLFWNASLQRGLFSRAIARSLGLDIGLCFMGGLLQDFLLPVLTNRFDSEYVRFMETDGRDGRDICDWEQETFGWDHAKAGAAVAHSWRFPDDLLCALFYHHELQESLQRPEAEFFNLFPVMCAALLPDQLTQTTSGVQNLIRIDAQCAAIDLDQLCITVDQEQLEQAEGYQIPRQLEQLVEVERRLIEQQQEAST